MIFTQVLSFTLSLYMFYIFILKDLFFIALITNIISITTVLIYVTLNASDLAITEIVAGFGISSIFTILSLIYINRQKNIIKESAIDFSSINKRVLFLVCGIIISFISSKILANHYNFTSNKIIYIKDLYIKNYFKDFGIKSIVTTIIAGYRALDTFLESMVILTGAFVVKNILKD